jgi:glutaredoxin
MKNKHILTISIIILLLLFPLQINALAKDYQDKLSDITNTKVQKDIINIYFFYGEGCPHCAKEKKFFKEELTKKYKNVKIYSYEVWNNENNSNLLKQAKDIFKLTNNNVPFTVIGDKSLTGYSDTTKEKIYNIIDEYQGEEVEENNYTLPLIGKVNVQKFSLPLISIILGLIDGFNPCAMWILLFLINILIGENNKKRMFILGNIFLLTSGLVYFLSMLGLTIVLNITTVVWIRNIIAVVAITLGILNLNTYRKTKNETGCHVVKNKKRKNLIRKIKEYTSKKSLLLAIMGIIVLAISVNLVELACSLGFPAVYSEILAINQITGFKRILYLIFYNIFYMLDDLIVFYIAVFTLNIKAISNKYSKYSNLIGGLIIFLIGLLLLLKPEWVMFNFN